MFHAGLSGARGVGASNVDGYATANSTHLIAVTKPQTYMYHGVSLRNLVAHFLKQSMRICFYIFSGAVFKNMMCDPKYETLIYRTYILKQRIVFTVDKDKCLLNKSTIRSCSSNNNGRYCTQVIFSAVTCIYIRKAVTVFRLINNWMLDYCCMNV